MRPAGPAEGRVQTLDLRAFTPRRGHPPSRWRHVDRRVDGRGRIPLPETEALARLGSLHAALRPGCWEVTATTRLGLGGAVRPDQRNRVLVPLGVRHQLGLEGAVLVSVALDNSRLVVWPAARLDDLLEVQCPT